MCWFVVLIQNTQKWLDCRFSKTYPLRPLAREDGSGETVTLKKLLPMSFGPGHLK
jgi:hypothetical protein